MCKVRIIFRPKEGIGTFMVFVGLVSFSHTTPMRNILTSRGQVSVVLCTLIEVIQFSFYYLIVSLVRVSLLNKRKGIGS